MIVPIKRRSLSRPVRVAQADCADAAKPFPLNSESTISSSTISPSNHSTDPQAAANKPTVSRVPFRPASIARRCPALCQRLRFSGVGTVKAWARSGDVCRRSLNFCSTIADASSGAEKGERESHTTVRPIHVAITRSMNGHVHARFCGQGHIWF